MTKEMKIGNWISTRSREFRHPSVLYKLMLGCKVVQPFVDLPAISPSKASIVQLQSSFREKLAPSFQTLMR